jgi:hypothetical protein
MSRKQGNGLAHALRFCGEVKDGNCEMTRNKTTARNVKDDSKLFQTVLTILLVSSTTAVIYSILLAIGRHTTSCRITLGISDRSEFGRLGHHL